MAGTYLGNPTGVQAPGVAPGLTVYPTQNLPSDGDALNVASILQALKVLSDNQAYLLDRVRDQIFGSAADGAITVAGGATFNASSWKNYSTFTAPSTSIINSNGWPIIARNSITLQGGINGGAQAAASASRGAYLAADGPFGCLSPMLQASTLSTAPYSAMFVAGLGGNGATGGGTAPGGTQVVSPGSSYKSFPYFTAGISGLLGVQSFSTGVTSGVKSDFIRGGGCGSPGVGSGAVSGGGGGAGGPLIVLCAPVINIGAVAAFTYCDASGGNGGASQATAGSWSGGGGGGGAFLFICQTLNLLGTVTFTAAAGVAGIGVPPGSASGGGAATAGNITPYVVIVP